jgi:hypothetical protein
VRAETKILADALVREFKHQMAEAVAPLEKQVVLLEARLNALPKPEKGDKGDAGKNADPVDVDAVVAKVVALVPRPSNGKDADPEMVKTEVAKAVAAIPKPADGRDADPVDLNALVAAVLAEVPPAKDGKDADPEFIRAEVARAVAALPTPKDGENGKDAEPVDTASIAAEVRALVRDGRDADPEFIRSEVAKAVAAIPKPKDGEPGKDAVVDVEAIVRAVRALVKDGRDADPEVIRSEVAKAVAEIPRPKDGASVHPDTIRLMVSEEARKAFAAIQLPKDGEPGRDAAHLNPMPSIDESKNYPRGTWARHRKGLWHAASDTQGMRGWECISAGVHDIKVEQTQERNFTVTVSLSDGDPVAHEFALPVVIYREIYRPETQYAKGDSVTYGGNLHIALVDGPTKKPGDVTDGLDGTPKQWRLAVKSKEGRSAYESARKAGFVGTEAEWVASLKSKK